MIKDGAIKVISSHIMRIENNKVIFGNKTEKEFNAIVFATGYKSVANKWLKDNYKNVLNEDGMPKNAFSMPFTLKTIICSHLEGINNLPILI
ncbi:probable indole-3-pyruvate monooxygenase YUCCA11 [Arachis duranensis]|uniref:Probable indole-3-pyruvate monooxygenase YUCCA11 n=1 Tax=Arachis duranensis TaxID=130453 RepID=A0A9C6WD46_ARADU|nr:probable indole-3-pyruvate monooxygenase YUCCA11 [Arachis duranensis]